MTKTYDKTHPWLTFQVDLRSAGPFLWMALGEAQSKCEHLAGVPLRPFEAHELHQMYLAKGIAATTAIEGNTLSENEVRARIEGHKMLPESQEYMGQEVDNILLAANEILDQVVRGQEPPLTPELLAHFNQMVLYKLKLEDGVVPGKIRKYDVGVGPYLCAPWQDCEHLVERLCQWLNGDDFKPRKGDEIAFVIIKAIVAHLYFVWIHPYGDGNGRTARLIEVKFLMEGGVPSAAAHLLSNHYNETRKEYYRQLDVASKSGGDITGFLVYAVKGLVDQLREQLRVVKEQQWDVTWKNYVHEIFQDHKSQADLRRYHLVLAISDHREPVPKTELRHLTPELAEQYATKTPKTVTRDLNALESLGLIRATKSGYVAKSELILAFLPKSRTEAVKKVIPKRRGRPPKRAEQLDLL